MNRNMKIMIGLLFVNLIIILVLFCTQRQFQIDSEPSLSGADKGEQALERPRVQLKTEIWSKAAIGQYFWEDILRGAVHRKDRFYVEGTFENNSVQILFRSGASLKVESLKAFTNINNLVLILNWRTKELANTSLPWLEAALSKPDIKNLGIVALGNEQCHNSWFERWIRSSPGAHKFRFLFIVYDWSKIDNQHYHQWPLGVATYRNFQSPSNKTSLIYDERPFLCNYIGTVYPSTSRQELLQLFTDHDTDNGPEAALKRSCIIKTRSKWIGEESDESMQFYRDALRRSELTLNPIGMNHECYRLYEAAAFGSVPVVEINFSHVTKTACDKENVFRLFHETNAPFIYVRNWTLEIGDVLRTQHLKSNQEKVQQRRELIEWYDRFKTVIKDKFIYVLQNKFNNQ